MAAPVVAQVEGPTAAVRHGRVLAGANLIQPFFLCGDAARPAVPPRRD
ncbi:MAG: hypothetical protein J7521_11820 [Caulobacter sp.]|nr:hypothetical protein [Caulobacter sp.]